VRAHWGHIPWIADDAVVVGVGVDPGVAGPAVGVGDQRAGLRDDLAGAVQDVGVVDGLRRQRADLPRVEGRARRGRIADRLGGAGVELADGVALGVVVGGGDLPRASTIRRGG
jgi:hypothetical protein